MKAALLLISLFVGGTAGSDHRYLGIYPMVPIELCGLAFFDRARGVCDASVEKIEHCLAYASKSECVFCAFGYFRAENGAKCLPIADRNCWFLEPSGVCSACLDGRVPDEDGNCATGQRCVENCEVCNDKENCFYCKIGFANRFADEKNTCVPNTPAYNNCWLGFEDRCLLCTFNAYLVEDRLCIPTPDYSAEVFPSRDHFASMV